MGVIGLTFAKKRYVWEPLVYEQRLASACLFFLSFLMPLILSSYIPYGEILVL